MNVFNRLADKPNVELLTQGGTPYNFIIEADHYFGFYLDSNGTGFN
jgi:hypothetical protein